MRSGLAIIMLSLLPALTPAQSAAAGREEVRAAIRNVLAAPEFDTRRETYEIQYVGEPLDLFGDDDGDVAVGLRLVAGVALVAVDDARPQLGLLVGGGRPRHECQLT